MAKHYSTLDILEELRLLCDQKGSQKAVAHWLNISEQYLSDVLSQRREPGPLIIHRLGYRKVNLYVKDQAARGEP